MAMGLASGYPLGAILTANLRKRQMCSKTEAERLMSFCNTADPLFMTGAVAVGMFGVASLGAVICGAHYLSAMAVGLVMAFYKRRSADRTTGIESVGGNIFLRACNAMVKARDEDNRPFGKLLGDAIRQSVNSLLLIGGFIILFSSIIAMLGAAGITSGIASALTALLRPVGVDPATISSMVSGLFEISLGTQMASVAPASLAQKLMAAGAIIAWSGLSVHMQVAAMVQGTDITMGPYICARAAHAVLAALFTLLLIGPGSKIAALIAVPALSSYEHASMGWLARTGLATSIFLKVSGLAVLGGLLLAVTVASRRTRR
jgi:sporulation integral membrane protein YlbJ